MLFSERLKFQNKFEDWCKNYSKDVSLNYCLMSAIIWMKQTEEGKKLVRMLKEDQETNQ